METTGGIPAVPYYAPMGAGPGGPGGGRSTDTRKRRTVLIGVVAAALVLVGGGIAAAVTILGGDDPNPQTSSDPDPTRETPTDDPVEDTECVDSPDLTEEECTLLNDAVAANAPLDPADCEGFDPKGAQVAITCYPADDNADFAPINVNVYGYGDAESMDEVFQDVIDTEGLTGPQKLDGAPGWGTWNYENESEDAGRLLLQYSDVSDTSYVAWTDTDALIEIWASADGNQLPELYQWWATS